MYSLHLPVATLAWRLLKPKRVRARRRPSKAPPQSQRARWICRPRHRPRRGEQHHPHEHADVELVGLDELLDRSDTDERFDVNGGTFALSFDGMVGGSPTEGFALGGGVSWLGGTSEISDDGVDATVGLLFVGPFFDAFPDPKQGWHLGAMAGYALHTIHDHPSDVSRTSGIGGAAWVGHDWWVSHEMSAGLMLKFSGALTSGEDGSGSLRANSTALTLLATALYH